LIGGDEHSRARAKAPESVIVVMLDRANMTSEYSNQIIENRKKYAERHGYSLFVKDSGDYQDGPGPKVSFLSSYLLVNWQLALVTTTIDKLNEF